MKNTSSVLFFYISVKSFILSLCRSREKRVKTESARRRISVKDNKSLGKSELPKMRKAKNIGTKIRVPRRGDRKSAQSVP